MWATFAPRSRTFCDPGKRTPAVQKYEVRRPEEESGGFEERYWSPQNSAISGPFGTVRYIIHRVEDVMGLMRLKQVVREREEQAQAVNRHFSAQAVQSPCAAGPRRSALGI